MATPQQHDSSPAESSPIRREAEERGDLQAPHTATGDETVVRVVRVPLVGPGGSDDDWRQWEPVAEAYGVQPPKATAKRPEWSDAERRAYRSWWALCGIAEEAARFANSLSAATWAEMHGFRADTAQDAQRAAIAKAEAAAWRARFEALEKGEPDPGPPKKRIASPGSSAYRRFKGRLSNAVRSAVSREVAGAWARAGKLIRRGVEYPPRFVSSRALAVRGTSKGTAGGVCLARAGDGFSVALTLVSSEVGPPLVFRVLDLALRKRRGLRAKLDEIAAGKSRLAKAVVMINRRRRRADLVIQYEMPVAHTDVGPGRAALGPLETDGTLILRSAGAQRDWTRELYALRAMKEHFEGLLRRLRRSIGRGPQWRRVWHKKVLEAGTYEAWARGKCHELSAHMVKWLEAEGVGELVVLPIDDGDWPAHSLRDLLKYKCEDRGIRYSEQASLEEADPTGPAAGRAAGSPIRKKQKQIARAKKAIRTLRDVTGQGGKQDGTNRKGGK